MTLDNIPGKKIFLQRDVRETPAATATATSVGLTDPLYVTLSTHADLVNERVLTAGEGIDMTDNGAGGSIVIQGEHATDTGNKGIATFSASDFDVALGVVTIDDSGVDHNAIGNTHNMTTDIDARITPGEGINYTTGTISCELATDVNLGIATFDTSDFNVTTGDVTLKADILKTIDGDTGTATTAVHNIDILGGTGISTVGESNNITITADVTTPQISPIGSVIAWLKSYTNTPQTLPAGWVECDGATLSDADSVYNGQVIPDLNGGNRFLRGDATSGGTGGATTSSHQHDTPFITDDDDFLIGIDTNDFGQTDAGSTPGTNYTNNTWGQVVEHTPADPQMIKTKASAPAIIPPYYNVVWIMRIK